MTKTKVEAIYPLTFMQQALLLHSLHQTDDQGFLQVVFNLEGSLNVKLFNEAWQQCVQRQCALRASIHWEKIKKPVQIIHPHSNIALNYYDWRQLSPKAQQKKIAKFKIEDRQQGFDLSKAPNSRLALFQLKPNEYQMLWSCHHILLDGCCAAIIIKDEFDFYNALCENKIAAPEPLPSYSSYLNQLQKLDLAQAKSFWQQKFNGFKKPTLLGTKSTRKPSDAGTFVTHSFSLSVDDTSRLKSFVRQHHLTQSTLIHGIWALLLGRYTNTGDATFGTTVSGRNIGLPSIELLAGMFNNVLPTRIQWKPDLVLFDWFKEVHNAQLEIQNFDHTTLDQISDWIRWPGELALLDSLLVFENIPWATLGNNEIRVRDFSGGNTSIYPVTVIIIPGAALRVLVKYNKTRVPKATAMWLSRQLEMLLQRVPAEAGATIGDLLNIIAPPPAKKNNQALNKPTDRFQLGPLSKNGKGRGLNTPRNLAEVQVAKIWEQIFGHSSIGITENFFDMGGTSMLAVKLLSLIDQKLKRNLPLSDLLQNPTIESLAKVLSTKQGQPNWSALVPLRTKGSKPPIFCIHAGGGHIYFYHALSQYLDDDQPVYSVQAIGLDGVTPFHESIEEMAAAYLKEMRSVQPRGPYAVIGICFSNAVTLEMAHQLKKTGESLSLLGVIDSGGRELGRRVRILEPTPPAYDRLKRFFSLDFKDARDAALKKILKKAEKLKKKWTILIENRQEHNLRKLQDHLGQLYEDYFWKPCQQRVTLIRSSGYDDDPNKDFHIERWSAIALGGLSVYIVPGTHETLFLEPDVQHLARQLQECLDKAHNESAREDLSQLAPSLNKN